MSIIVMCWPIVGVSGNSTVHSRVGCVAAIWISPGAVLGRLKYVTTGSRARLRFSGRR